MGFPPFGDKHWLHMCPLAIIITFWLTNLACQNVLY
jgi:hypothetical protein